MYEKITELIKNGMRIEQILHRAYKVGASYSGGRFGGFFIAWQDFKNYPILGTGGNSALSYGYIDKGVGVAIINGLAQIISTYGIFGLFFYIYCSLKSSLYVSEIYDSNTKYGILIIIMLSSFSFSLHSQIMLFSVIFYSAYLTTDS